jgi:hypothetical protein
MTTTQLKLRVYKNELMKALFWYENQITEKFQSTPLTQASLELMNRHLIALQQIQQKREPNNVWKVEVAVKPNVEWTNFFIVPNEKNLLYLDFDMFE